MNRRQFEEDYNMEFITPNPHYEYSYKKWLEYYYQTELYDRKICTGFNEKTGDAVPTSTVEYTDINRNAKRLMNVIVCDFRDKGIEKSTWISARCEASKYSHEEVKEMLIRLSQ
ncbi:hypothetical protein NV379_01795 [Paenibacillus sp. N1-5-1-14]|uniref:hypothetical protein n=1 Tax=Paenibacillus radicibacter TaxID=2972488 RepID=UPI0021594BCC|nr:hypothetical protein [Paenibacillus radicibacter]MCR8641378.1 hypothetical protein [Paenibacillus radicibacter]